MDPLGVYLKQAREEKGLTLKHLAQQTRIPEYHLQGSRIRKILEISPPKFLPKVLFDLMPRHWA